MTQYRRINNEDVYPFFRECKREYSNVSGNFIRIREVLDKNRVSRLANFAAFKAILHPRIPYPVKELLCAALRERILVDDPNNKRLESLCIRDKLRSRQAKGLSTGTVFGAKVVFFGRTLDESKLAKGVREALYHES